MNNILDILCISYLYEKEEREGGREEGREEWRKERGRERGRKKGRNKERIILQKCSHINVSLTNKY